MDASRPLAWLDRAGEMSRSIDRSVSHPSASPVDGRVAADSRFADGLDIWTFDERGTETRLTTGGTNDFPIWSPDGEMIVFSATGGDLPRLGLMRADGVGSVEVLWQGKTVVRPTSWSSDGQFLALEAQSEETARDVWVLQLERSADTEGLRVRGEPARIHDTAFTEGGAVFSPDGRWLAYVSTETGRAEVYVESFPALDERIAVSSGGGVEPAWSRDGETLFYRAGDSFLGARVSTEPNLRADPARVLFDTSNAASNTHRHYDILAEGFVIRWERVPLNRQRIRIVTNLYDRIAQLTPER